MIIMFLLQMKQGLEGYGLLIYLRVSVAGQVLGITDFQFSSPFILPLFVLL